MHAVICRGTRTGAAYGVGEDDTAGEICSRHKVAKANSKDSHIAEVQLLAVSSPIPRIIIDDQSMIDLTPCCEGHYA